MPTTQPLIFLTDDDRDDLTMFQEALLEIDSNIRFKGFENGVELMERLLKVDEELPNAIYLDLNMPLMNGEECVDDIRAEARFNEIPIIIYSSYVDELKMDIIQKKGANLYLVKPSSFDNLKSALRKSLGYVQTVDKAELKAFEFVIVDE
ncbi:response regulator [Aurantibacter crassamenti]|uniref:response regulator n=1 Tax=Aurantibacter crassamenti TaxID=1837375 RepID=UPI0019395B7F|nr:response regulator [Aurantibacter crassamenti]MBM1104570.1 response regulator [Aurantibacter crassamenti]